MPEWRSWQPSHSRLSRREPGANDFAGRVVLGIADNRHPSSVLADDIPFGNALGGVVGALGVNVGMNLADDGAYVALTEDHHGVDVGKGSEDFCALFGGHQGTAFTFQRTHRFIRVKRNYQATTESLGRGE